jgi:hypothetical protein
LFEEATPLLEDVGHSPGATVAGTLTDYRRPLLAGMQASYTTAGGVTTECTMGYTGRWYGNPVLVMNTHCSGTWGGLDVPATYYYQAGGYLGPELADQNHHTCWAGYFFMRCRRSDANMVSISGDAIPPFPQIARTRHWNGSTELETASYLPPFRVIGEQPYSVAGQMIDKVGVTTGWTYGYVTKTCSDYVTTGSVFNNRALTCVDEASYTSAAGDSGAPVFMYNDGMNVIMTGIHAGHYWRWNDQVFRLFAVFSPMHRLHDDYTGLARCCQ